MASYVGSEVKITATDGVYEGVIHSIDEANARITLDKVKVIESGTKLNGLIHFYGQDMLDIKILNRRVQTKEVQQNDHGPTLMRRKLNPPHLKKLRDIDRSSLFLKDRHRRSSGASSSEGEETTAKSYMSEDERNSKSKTARRRASYSPQLPQTKQVIVNSETTKAANVGSVQPSVPTETDKYTVISEIGELCQKAIDCIKKQSRIGLSMEGVSIDRDGRLCWIQICVPKHVFLFDVLKLGDAVFKAGLAEILQSTAVEKICHDCRFLSDMLFHKYKVKIDNVFDTQVAAAISYKICHGGDLPRYVSSLSTCLFEHLDLKPEDVYIQRARESQLKEDMQVWAERPASAVIIDAAVKKVCHLLELREVLFYKMLTDFSDGVSIYLSIVRDAEGDGYNDKRIQGHVLPAEFKNLQSCAEERRTRFLRLYNDKRDYDDQGFRENCPGILDPMVKFSHDGCWHAGSGEVERMHSPDPLRMVRRGRARTTNERKRSHSRDNKKHEMVMELGSAELRKQQKASTVTNYTEVVGKETDIQAVLDMPFMETTSIERPNRDHRSNQDQRSRQGQRSTSALNGVESSTKGFKIIAAGYESSCDQKGTKQGTSSYSQANTLNNSWNDDDDDNETYGAIPDSKEAIKNASMLSSNVKNRLPRCAMQNDHSLGNNHVPVDNSPGINHVPVNYNSPGNQQSPGYNGSSVSSSDSDFRSAFTPLSPNRSKYINNVHDTDVRYNNVINAGGDVRSSSSPTKQELYIKYNGTTSNIHSESNTSRNSWNVREDYETYGIIPDSRDAIINASKQSQSNVQQAQTTTNSPQSLKLLGLSGSDSETTVTSSVQPGRGRAKNLHHMLQSLKIGASPTQQRVSPSAHSSGNHQFSDSDNNSLSPNKVPLGRAKTLEKYAER